LYTISDENEASEIIITKTHVCACVCQSYIIDMASPQKASFYFFIFLKLNRKFNYEWAISTSTSLAETRRQFWWRSMQGETCH